MTAKTWYSVLLAAMAPALLNAQELRIVSFRRDVVTGNYSLTWTNQPLNLYCGLLGAYSADDDFWQAAASPLWNLLTTNSSTTIPGLHFSPPMLFAKVVCSTKPLSLPPCPSFQVPVANITVDGDTADWSGIQPAISDRAGDAYLAPAGSDMTALYLARDNTKASLRIDVTNGPPASSLFFDVGFYTNYFAVAGDRFVVVDVGGMSCSVEQYTCSGSGGCHTNLANGTVVVKGNVIEASVPFSALNPPSPSYIRAYHQYDTTRIVKATFP
jgi:hypothetical protein